MNVLINTGGNKYVM